MNCKWKDCPHGAACVHAAAPADEPTEYPECSGDPSSCPENEGYGCCEHAAAVSPPVAANTAGLEIVARWIEAGGPAMQIEANRTLMAATVRAAMKESTS